MNPLMLVGRCTPLFFGFLISHAGIINAAEENALAAGPQLKKAIAGNTVQGSMDGAGKYTEFYAKDGTVRSKDYQAKWSIEGDTMCWVYTGQPKDCWRASIKGNQIKWIKDGKVQGTGTIVQGNSNRY
jgi:hypothetical protein